jgi:hypothetical protein
VLLLITAGILTAMILPAYWGQEPAAYGDSSVRQGQYILATGGYDENIDLVYVINIETQKLVVYAPNLAKRSLDKMGVSVSLKQTPRN